MSQWALPTIAVLLVGYGAVSGRLQSTVVTQAMVFVALGLRAGQAVPHILAELLSPGTGLDPMTALRQAAAAAIDNPDVYSPSEKTCAAVVTTLVASGDG